MSLHYLVKQHVCQTVHNHSNGSIKRHDKLTVTDKHITTNAQSGFDTRIKTFRHWLIAWSVTLCLILDHAKIVSSGTFAECFCVWCVPLISAKWPVSLAIWRVVLCVPDAPSWLSAKSLTASMFSAVRGLLLPGCQSVVPVSRSI